MQIRQLQEKRTKASREIIHLAAEAKLAVAMTNKAVAAYVTFDDEMAAIEARVSVVWCLCCFFCAVFGEQPGSSVSAREEGETFRDGAPGQEKRGR